MTLRNVLERVVIAHVVLACLRVSSGDLDALARRRHAHWTVELSDEEDWGDDDKVEAAANGAAAGGVAAASGAAAVCGSGGGGGGVVELCGVGVVLGSFEKAVGDYLATGWAERDPVDAVLTEVGSQLAKHCTSRTKCSSCY